MGEQDEARLHALIAETARDLVGAQVTALTLRPAGEDDKPLVPSEGHRFHLAAIVGMTKEQEAQLRRMPPGGAGLLAPIFRHAVPGGSRRSGDAGRAKGGSAHQVWRSAVPSTLYLSF